MPDNKPLSKDGVLDKIGRTLAQCKKMFSNDKILIPDHLFYVAMDEYARQECIEFEIWRERHNYHKDPNGFYCRQPPTAGVKTWFTIEELYSLYISEQEKIK